MKKIILVLPGIHHPTSMNSIKALNTMTHSLHKNGIPTIIASEYSQEVTVDIHIKTLELNLALGSQNKPKEEAELAFCQFLEKSKIPFRCIDMPNKMGTQLAQEYMQIKALNSQNLLNEHALKWEPLRINAMKDNLIKCIADLKTTGGVILAANHGAIHTQKLAYEISEAMKKDNKANIELEIITLNWLPSSINNLFKINLNKIQSKDSQAHQAYYNTHPVQEWPLETASNGTVDCPKLHQKLLDIFKPEIKFTIDNSIVSQTQTYPIRSLASLEYLYRLQSILGNFQAAPIVQIDPKKEYVSFPIQWLNDVNRGNPQGIEELTRKLDLPKDNLFKKY